MDTMQLSCFVEVAAQISFSKAAEALHVSQPTVSQIKALEDELGCALLARSTRTVRLTDDGFAFLEYANDILDLAARRASLETQAAPELAAASHRRTVHTGHVSLAVPAAYSLL